MSFIQYFFQKLLGPKHNKKAIVYYGEYSFSSIPIDLGAYVLSFLSFKDILQISLVSKHYYQICSSSMLWEQYCAQTWINTVLKNPARAEFEQKMLLASLEASQQTAPAASSSAGGAGGSTTASAAATTTTAAPGASTTVTVAPVVPVTAPPATSSPLQKLSRASSFFGKLGRTSSSNNMSQAQASSSASPVTSPTSSSALKLAQQEEMLLARQKQMQQAATMNSVKRFLESLQSMHSENFNWRDSYVNTKPILFSNSVRDEEDPCGLFYFLGCYEPRIKISPKEKNSSMPTSPVTPLRSHSASNLFKAFTHSLHHSASASTLSPSGSASPSMAAGGSSSSNFSAQGSVNKKDKYTNPAIISENALHKVRITSSSQKVGKMSSWISRKQSACWTENNKYSYFQIDMGKFMKFIPTHYRMRYGSKSWKVLPRNWDFLGSNDGISWKVIRSHHEDDTFKKQDYSPASWLVDQKTSSDVFGEAFRYFRIVLTDRTASQHPEWEYVLVVTGVEFFGFLLMSPQYDEYMRMLSETKATELICSIAHKESMTKIKSLVCNWFEKHFKISDPITPFGETLLHIAAQHNYTDCVHWLVTEKGADISALTDSGQSIYEVTKNMELKDMIHQFQISQLSLSLKNQGKDLNQKLDRQSEEIQQLRDMVMFLMQQQKQASSKLQLAPPSPKPKPATVKKTAQEEDDEIEVVPVMPMDVIADFREEKDEKII